jgi:Flp pilus assembly CpaF family ATPase
MTDTRRLQVKWIVLYMMACCWVRAASARMARRGVNGRNEFHTRNAFDSQHRGACWPIRDLLAESTVLDVCVNPDGKLWVNRLGRGFTHEGDFTTADSALLLSGIATVRDLNLNEKTPILETIFPLTGDRIEGLVPPIVAAPAFAIRTRQKQLYELRDMEDLGILTHKDDERNQKRPRDDFLDHAPGLSHLEVLRLVTKYRRNVLLVGPTGSGKTTFANSLIDDWHKQTPGDRVVIIEDTPELQCASPNRIELLATRAITQADCLVAALRLIPKRLVVGEVREPEPARVLLSAWNTGHSGGLATIHADDAVAGLRKFESLVGDRGARERIAAAVGLVVFIDGDETLPAGRKVPK